MKEYLDFEDGDITISNDGTYIDDLELEEEFEDDFDLNNLNENVENVNIEELPNSSVDDYNPLYLDKLNASDKKYLDGDYNYKDDVIKEKKQKKVKKKKVKRKKESRFDIVDILNSTFKIILFFARVLFCLVLLLSIFIFILWDGQKNDELKDLEKLSTSESVIVESIVTSMSENQPTVYNNFVKDVQSYMSSLTEIVNGELIIIDNLNKGIITEKDAYNYFNKTLIKKGDMLSSLEKTDFPEELSTIVNLVKQITINASNNSKLIMNRFLVNDGAGKMISDMSSFYSKYLTDCDLLSSYLGSIS